MATILLIEDEAQVIAFMTKGLERAGYQVQAVQDGKQALPLALSGEFDLILLDLGLPSLNGQSVLKKIRGQQLETPVIVVTALNVEPDQILALGANDYISKPFRFSELLATIRSYI
ncbi:MAG: response regulator transcription factor [Leptolyngbya sp. SIO3F4]|nr:response regulator transcription factor [Leptolyngbya sp. SIO3F4]